MVTDDRQLRFGWRGTHIFTPGTEHGCGCITLLPSHIQPGTQSIVHLDQRGHIFKAQINKVDVHFLIVKNAYLPSPPPPPPTSNHITHTTQPLSPKGSKESK